MAGVLGRQHQQQPAARRRLNSTRSSSSASRRHTTRPAKFRDAWGIASNKRSLPRSRLRFASRAGVYVYLVTSVGHLSAATFGRSGSASISDAGKPSPDLAASMSRAGRNLLHMVARTEERSPLGREHGFAPLRVAFHQSAGWWGLERSANTSRLPSKGASLVSRSAFSRYGAGPSLCAPRTATDRLGNRGTIDGILHRSSALHDKPHHQGNGPLRRHRPVLAPTVAGFPSRRTRAAGVILDHGGTAIASLQDWFGVSVDVPCRLRLSSVRLVDASCVDAISNHPARHRSRKS